MGLNKVTYVDGSTVITAANLNNIQDAVIDLEATRNVPTNIRTAIYTLLENAAYATTGLEDEIAIVEAWAAEITSLTLSASTLSLNQDVPQTLTATTIPSGITVAWASSDSSVATVSDGVVTGVSNGSCTITASAGDLSATCDVTVSGFVEMVTITNTLNGCTSSNSDSSATKGDSYSATITASSGYTMVGASVVITMGGVDITSTAYDNGNISIDSVTGNLAISAVAVFIPRIPSAYQEVEYLQSTGSERIDTGVKGDLTTSVELTMQRLSALNVVARMFGDRASSTTAQARGIFLATQTSTGTALVYYQMDGAALLADTMPAWSLTEKYHILGDSTGITINETKYDSWGNTPTTFETQNTLAIFNARQNGTWGTGMAAKLWDIIIKKNNAEVFNGVPCYRKSDNVAGLYDLVTETFFTNSSGSGAFIVGGDRT